MGSLMERVQRSPIFEKFADGMAERFVRIANRCMYKPHLFWWNDRTWLESYESYVDGTRNLDRRFTIAKWAESVRRLPGSTAECGVYTGVTSGIICKALEGTYAPGDVHFGFDSFDGLSEPVEQDTRPAPEAATSYGVRQLMTRQWRRGSLRSPLEVAAEKLDAFPFCKLVQGWIPDCLAEIGEQRFRFAHVDVDLYQPTLDSLQFFYPRLISGAVMICDDFGMMTCPGARQAVDEFCRTVSEPFVELSTGQAVLVKD